MVIIRARADLPAVCRSRQFAQSLALALPVTIGAVQTQRGGKEPHRVHEFLDGNATEDLDVLEGASSDELRLLARRPPGRRDDGLSMQTAATSRVVSASAAPQRSFRDDASSCAGTIHPGTVSCSNHAAIEGDLEMRHSLARSVIRLLVAAGVSRPWPHGPGAKPGSRTACITATG